MPTPRRSALAVLPLAALAALAAAPAGAQPAVDVLVVANKQEATATVIDAATGRTLATLPTGEAPHEVAISPDGREVCVGSNTNHTVTVIDTRRWAPVATVATPGLPYRVNMAPDGKTAVVSNPEAERVRLVDVAGRRERAAMETGGGGPVGGVVARDGRHAYVALQNSGEVAMVNLATGAEVRRFTVGAGPDGIAVTTRRAPAAQPPVAQPPVAQPPTAQRPAAPPPAAAGDAEREVLAVVQRLFDAMRTRDTAALRAAFVPGASMATTTMRNGQPVVEQDSVDAFVRSIAAAPPGLLLDERLRDPQVRVSDGLASVWVDYDFYAGERFSHCGVDAFHLARTPDGWRVVHIADTRRREGCAGRP